MIELKEATIEVAGRKVIDRLSMLAYDGRITCITGASGSGKTLLLRAMMGFVPLDEGYLTIDGELVSALSIPVFRKMMVWLPQKLWLYGERQWEPSIEPLGYEDYDTTAATLPPTVTMGACPKLTSGQTVELIERKLSARGKHIVVADDPLAGLSQEDGERVMRMLREHTAAGLTVVMSTSNRAVASATDVVVNLG